MEAKSFMNTLKPKNRRPFIITKPIEAILRAIHFYRYMTAQDVTRLLYSPSSLTHVREILASLAGGADFKANQYLYRFQLSNVSTGSTRIFTLGSKGRDFLANELGLPVDWYFRSYKVKHFSFSQVVHNLVLTRFLVSAYAWAAKQPDFRLTQTRICYEFAREAAIVGVSKDTLPAGKQRKTERLKVIPDAWIEFQRNDGKKFPILLEVDRGMEYSRKFMRHVRSRIEFIRSGEYKKMFQTDAVLIAYLTTGERPEYRATRRAAMCAWAQDVLAELHMENWANIFRFTSVLLEELYISPIFDEPIWYRPDESSPVPLFTPSPAMKGKVYGQ
jgi:Replication-relaxation